MDSQTLAAWAGIALSVLIASRSLFARLTHHGSARLHLQRAELLRRVGVDDLADAHERAAREDVLRPTVIKNRGILRQVSWLGPFGHITWNDLAVFGLLPVVVGAFRIFGPTPVGFGIFGVACIGIVIALHREDQATNHACSELADRYDAPSAATDAPDGPRPWLLVVLILAIFRHRH